MDFLHLQCPRCNPTPFVPADRVNHHQGDADVFFNHVLVFCVIVFNLQCFYLLQRSVPSW